MSTFGIFAFIVMPVLGGLIAWAGDVIGYRLGKSRRSLFGLRPRSTARLVGVAVGVALPLLGLLTALAGSSDVRDALLHIDDLRRTEKQLHDSNAKLQAQIARATVRARESEEKARRYGGRLQRVSEDLSRAGLQLQAANSRVRVARQAVADLQADKAALTRLRDVLQTRVTQLRGRSRELKTKVGDLGIVLSDTQKTLDEVQAALDRTKQELTLQREVTSSRVVFETGHELVRVIMETGDTLEQTEAKLLRLLEVASLSAQAQGAEIGDNKLAVRLDGPQPFPDKPAAGPASEGDILAAFARERQAQGKQKWVIMVRVLRRMYDKQAGQASVEFYALPYAFVFGKDALVYAVTVDGRQDRTRIFSTLWNLVTKVVRREAREAGLLRDPETNEYGQMPPGELLEALDAVAAAGRPVRVEVRAERETRVGDPLEIRLEVTKEGGATPGANGSGG